MPSSLNHTHAHSAHLTKTQFTPFLPSLFFLVLHCFQIQMGWLRRVSVVYILLLTTSALGFGFGFDSGTPPESSVGNKRGCARWRTSLLGSSPPTCRLKCGRCRPCMAVHVPIEAGMSTATEYYPEAWRCKCRDKLFMP